MKRTRAKSNVKPAEKNDSVSKYETETKSKDSEYIQTIGTENMRNQKLRKTLETLQNQSKTIDTTEPYFQSSLNNAKNSDQKQKSKLNLKNLRDRNKKINEEFKPNVLPSKNKPRTVVDLKMMEEELKQLEDPPSTAWEKRISSNRLPFSFFDSPCEELAQNLLGKVLVRCLENGTILKGRIVETESYLGVIDKASHTYQNKVTARNMPMYMPPGEGCAVLVRAAEPLEGIESMTTQRTSKGASSAPKKSLRDLKIHELCNGPSKLCMAFQLHKSHSKYSMCSWKGLWVENGNTDEEIKIVKCRRIGIDNYGEEWTNKPLRYYIQGNKAVSKRNKEAESLGLS